MISFPQADVLAACRVRGHDLDVSNIDYMYPDGTVKSINPVALMLAIAAVESGGGQLDYAGHDCGPRFEPAYAPGGKFYETSQSMRMLYEEWNKEACCSYGPWQMMFDNFVANPPVQPSELNSNLDLLALQFVNFFNHYVLHFNPTTLEEVGEIWNAGHITPDPQYTDKLDAAYHLASSLVPEY